MKKTLLVLAITLIFVVPAAAEINEKTGRSLGLEFAPGMMGSLSFMQVGVTLPTIGSSFQIGVKARILSSLTWATFIDQETGEQASFHPVTSAGIISFGGSGPIMHGFMRPYGATDILAGYTFTPYDNFIYGTGNLVGSNITFGVFGYFGLELFTSDRMSIFLDAGGGFKTLKPEDDENIYVIAASWLGSGFGLKMGIRFYP